MPREYRKYDETRSILMNITPLGVLILVNSNILFEERLKL